MIRHLPAGDEFGKLDIVKFDPAISATGVDPATMHARAVSVARRLLQGSGRASLLAYRESPQLALSVLAHELLPDGRLIVAVSDGGATGADGEVIDVRMDIEKDAPEPDLRIRAASMHALGALSWLDGEVVGLRGLVADLQGIAGVRLATVRTPRLLLHDCAGVTPIGWEEVADGGGVRATPGLFEELDAAEAVAGLPAAVRVGIVEAVVSGRREGEVLARLEFPAACPEAFGTVRCVDVDAHGVSLMHFRSSGATTVFVPFADAAADLDTLRLRVGALPHRSWSPAR